MGPKKSDKKAPKGADGEVQGEDPALFLQNYQRFSRLIGISANPKVVSQLQSDENQPLAQVCVPMYPSRRSYFCTVRYQRIQQDPFSRR